MDGGEGRLTTERLLDAVYSKVSTGVDTSLLLAHSRLVASARRFALKTSPTRPKSASEGSLHVSAGRSGWRMFVHARCGNASIRVSGPPGMDLLWKLDTIDATEAEAVDLLGRAACLMERARFR